MSKYSSSTAMIDLLFNLLLAFICLFILSFILINPQNDSGKIDPKAEFLILLSWDDQSRNDIDLWVQDPHGEVVSFTKREVELMHLDRDARGIIQNVVLLPTGEEVMGTNQEIVTIRGYIPGEYIVNIHGYSVPESPIETNVQVIKLNPYQMVCKETVFIQKVKEERTVCRFELDSTGKVVQTNNLFKRLFGSVR